MKTICADCANKTYLCRGVVSGSMIYRCPIQGVFDLVNCVIVGCGSYLSSKGVSPFRGKVK